MIYKYWKLEKSLNLNFEGRYTWHGGWPWSRVVYCTIIWLDTVISGCQHELQKSVGCVNATREEEAEDDGCRVGDDAETG